MQLEKVLSSLASSLRTARIENRTATRLKRYRRSPELRLSRLYGYRLLPNGNAEIVPGEAQVIRLVIEMLGTGSAIRQVKMELDKRGLRNRSSKRWSVGEIMALAGRVLYAGLVRGPIGVMRRSTVYPPIVSLKAAAKAQKALKMQVEGALQVPLAVSRRGRNDAAIMEVGLGLKVALESPPTETFSVQ